MYTGNEPCSQRSLFDLLVVQSFGFSHDPPGVAPPFPVTGQYCHQPCSIMLHIPFPSEQCQSINIRWSRQSDHLGCVPRSSRESQHQTLLLDRSPCRLTSYTFTLRTLFAYSRMIAVHVIKQNLHRSIHSASRK